MNESMDEALLQFAKVGIENAPIDRSTQQLNAVTDNQDIETNESNEHFFYAISDDDSACSSSSGGASPDEFQKAWDPSLRLAHSNRRRSLSSMKHDSFTNGTPMLSEANWRDVDISPYSTQYRGFTPPMTIEKESDMVDGSPFMEHEKFQSITDNSTAREWKSPTTHITRIKSPGLSLDDPELSASGSLVFSDFTVKPRGLKFNDPLDGNQERKNKSTYLRHRSRCMSSPGGGYPLMTKARNKMQDFTSESGVPLTPGSMNEFSYSPGPFNDIESFPSTPASLITPKRSTHPSKQIAQGDTIENYSFVSTPCSGYYSSSPTKTWSSSPPSRPIPGSNSKQERNINSRLGTRQMETLPRSVLHDDVKPEQYSEKGHDFPFGFDMRDHKYVAELPETKYEAKVVHSKGQHLKQNTEHVKSLNNTTDTTVGHDYLHRQKKSSYNTMDSNLSQNYLHPNDNQSHNTLNSNLSYDVSNPHRPKKSPYNTMDSNLSQNYLHPNDVQSHNTMNSNYNVDQTIASRRPRTVQDDINGKLVKNPLSLQHNLFNRAELMFLKKIGKGASGIVYEAFHVTSLKILAVKTVSVYDTEKRKQSVAELRALYHNLIPLNQSLNSFHTQMEHYVDSDEYDIEAEVPNVAPPVFERCRYVVGFYEAYVQPNTSTINLILEWMNGGSVQDLLDVEIPLEEKLIANIAYCTARGLHYIHSKRQIHRDIKPSNLLLRTNGMVKVGDFGISHSFGTGSNSNAMTFVGSVSYMSPERISGSVNGYSYASDIWSLGLTLLACAKGKKQPYSDSATEGGYFGLAQEIMNGPTLQLEEFESGRYHSCELRNLIELCLMKNPNDRITAEEILRHPFILKHNIPSIHEHHMLSQEFEEEVKRLLKRDTSSETTNAMEALDDLLEMVIEYHTTQSSKLQHTLPRFSRKKLRGLCTQLGIQYSDSMLNEKLEMLNNMQRYVLQTKATGKLKQSLVSSMSKQDL